MLSESKHEGCYAQRLLPARMAGRKYAEFGDEAGITRGFLRILQRHSSA